MKLGIVSDHRGYNLKKEIIERVQSVEIEDYGTFSTKSVDYPDYAFLLGKNITSGNVDMGVAICGSGIGISIACNKVRGIRCGKVDSVEDVYLTRNDNDANVIAFKGDTPIEKALEYIDTFINTPFSEEEKHHRRVDKIKEYEVNNEG